MNTNGFCFHPIGVRQLVVNAFVNSPVSRVTAIFIPIGKALGLIETSCENRLVPVMTVISAHCGVAFGLVETSLVGLAKTI